MNRREFLVVGSIAGAAYFRPDHAAADLPAAGGPAKHEANLTLEDKSVAFSVPPLPYAYDALEPYIDAKTMQIHHDLHHKAYVDNLNKAIASHPELASKSIEDLLRHITSVPDDIRQAVINQGGGHYNHTLFWEIMAKNSGGKPTGPLAEAIDTDLGGFDKLQETLSARAVGQFGSGWAWLVVDGGKLKIDASANQNSPLLKGPTPI